MINMAEEKEIKWNGHKATKISMTSDEGEFSLDGKTVLLKRGNYGLLVNWVDTTKGGCFEVVPVNLLEDGSVQEIAEFNKDFSGGLDIWSQGYSLFRWRENWKFAETRVPKERELSKFENKRDARRPKLVVFIPPEDVDTDE